MSGADRVEDGFPHGTVEGFKAGCRNGGCPAGAEHGLSCKRAQILRAGDYRYQRLVREGKSPWEIADALGLVPDTRDVPKQGKVPVADGIEEEDDVEVEGLDEQEGEEVMVEQVVVPTPKDVAPKQKATKPEPTARARKVWSIREWAKKEGIEVAGFGRIPREVEAAYDEAHTAEEAAPEGEALPAGTVIEAFDSEGTKFGEGVVDENGIVTFDAGAAAHWPHRPTPEELAEFWEDDGTIDGEAAFALLVVDEVAKTSQAEADLAAAHTALEVTLSKWAEARDEATRLQGFIFAQAREHTKDREAWQAERARMVRLLTSYEYRIAELEAPDPIPALRIVGAHVAAPAPWWKRFTA